MLKKRTLALLLSLAMLLTFMPAMAFADDTADDAADQPEAVAVEEAGTEEAVVENEDDDAEAAVVEAAAEEAVEPMEALDAGTEEEPEVKSISYSGPTIYFEPDQEPSDAWPFVDGAKFTITYVDGKSRVAVVKEFSEDSVDFFFEDEKPKMETDEYGDEYPSNSVALMFDYEKATVANGLPVSYGDASTTVPVAQRVYAKPTKVEFIPANGFVAESRIGEDHVYNYELFGEGNKFVITWDDGNVHTYQYKNDPDEEGFYLTGFDGEARLFYEDIKLDSRVPAGTSTVKGKVTVGTDYGSEQCEVQVKVNASMFHAYVESKTYTYTGKNIKPKVVVKYFDGKKMKKMPAKWYTCKPKKYKAIGPHYFQVKIKKKYQAKYGASLYGDWEILPKTPAIKKVTLGKDGTLTVTWGKFSKKFQRSISGFYVQVGPRKDFDFWYEDFDAKPGASKATIKLEGYDPGTYYVRVVSHKTTKGNETSWWSKPSKVKTITVK